MSTYKSFILNVVHYKSLSLPGCIDHVFLLHEEKWNVQLNMKKVAKV